MMRRICLALAALSAALVAATPARAQAAGGDAGRAGVRLIRPLQVTKLADLDFGTVALTGAGGGTVTIDPDLDGAAAIATTGLLAVSGSPHAAKFGGAAVKDTVVIIRVPKKPVTMTRIGGSETIPISNFTVEGNDKRALAAMEAFDFKVGGTISVAAGQAEGTYEGTFLVEVHYP